MIRKKLLAGALGAVAALSVSSASFANGDYYGDAYTSSTWEYPAGFYLGIAGGYATPYWDDLEGWNDSATAIHPYTYSTDKGNFMGRIFIGYDFNQYFALEGGYSYIGGTDVDVYSKVNGSKLFSDNGKMHAADISAKLAMPLDNGFNLYAKLGVGYLRADDAITYTIAAGMPVIKRDRNSKVNVTYGAGGDYCFNPNVHVRLEWQRFNGDSDQGDDFLPVVDTYSIGVSYKFPV